MPRTAARLDILTRALAAINGCGSVEEVVDAVTEQARTLLGARRATCTLVGVDRGVEAGSAPELAVDLTAHDGARLGVLGVSGKIDGRFGTDDEDVLTHLAGIAAAAIERTRLQGQLERRLTQLQGLAEAAVAVLSPPLSEQAVLEHLTRAAAEIVGAQVAVTAYTGGDDRSREHTAVHVSGPHGDGQADAFAPPTSVAELVAASNASVRLGPGELGDGSHDPSLPVTGLLAAPLRSREGEHLGLVYLRDKLDGSDFSAEDQAILEQLATLASVSAERARLYESHAQQEAARFRDELLAGMSHDMQTPLAVIVGIADSLSEEPELPVEDRVPIYATIARQARRLRSLVNQFLDFSRIEADRPLALDVQPVDVVGVIDHVVPLFTHQREIIVGADGDLPLALGDRERLEQVLVNLISNAVKYSGLPIRVVARLDDGHVVIDVVDDGPGMTEAELEHVFDKFQRGSASTGTRGTGLGLYISRALTEAQGGRLTATSQAGIGSRFRVSLQVGS